MLERYLKITNRSLDFLGTISSILLFLLVLLLCFNVFSRYVFNTYSIAIDELSWHFYAAIFLLGIPYALRTHSHVRVDVFYDKWQPRTQAWIDVIGAIVFLLPTCIVIIWAGYEFTAAAYRFGPQPDSLGAWFTQLISSGIGEKSQDVGGLLNRWLIKGVIPFSFVCLLLASINFMLEKIQILRQVKQS